MFIFFLLSICFARTIITKIQVEGTFWLGSDLCLMMGVSQQFSPSQPFSCIILRERESNTRDRSRTEHSFCYVLCMINQTRPSSRKAFKATQCGDFKARPFTSRFHTLMTSILPRLHSRPCLCTARLAQGAAAAALG